MAGKLPFRTAILICELCDASWPVRIGDELPAACPVCKTVPPKFRYALDGEYTRHDRLFLKRKWIAATV